MKIQAEQLPTYLQKNLAQVYLLCGEELLLLEEAAQLIRDQAQQTGFNERKIWHTDSGFDSEAFLATATNFSLFSEKTLLELHIPDGKLNENIKNLLETYLTQLPSDKILLIVTGKFDSKWKTAAWFKLLDEKGIYISFWPLTDEQLNLWIHKHLQQKKLSTTREGTQLIKDFTEGNLLATQQAIEKLSLNYPAQQQLSTAEIAEVLTQQTHFDIFNLVDQILLGNQNKLITILRELKTEGVEPTILLWSLTRELRNLIGMQRALQQRKTLLQIWQEYKIWDKRKPIIQAAIKRLSMKKLYLLLQQATTLDRIIKGAAPGNIWNEFEKFCLQIAK